MRAFVGESRLEAEAHYCEHVKMNEKLEVKDVAGRGRSVVTRELIKKGTVVLEEYPYAHVVNYKDPWERLLCHRCVSVVDAAKSCGKCSCVWYCSDVCRDADSTIHVLECPLLSKLRSSTIFDDDCKTLVKMVVRIVVRRSLDVEAAKDILALEGNKHLFTAIRMSGLARVGQFIEKNLALSTMAGLTHADLIHLMCILECNTHEIGLTIRSLPPVPKPTGKVTLEGQSGRLAFITITDVAAGSELFYNYIQVSMPLEDRLRKLKDSYFFDCQCPGCRAPAKRPTQPLHKKFSFRFGFLLLGLAWAVFRAVFWGVFDMNTNPLGFSIIYWIPINIQFATYALLVLFYAHVVHRATWERTTKKRFTIAYILVNAVLLILQCAWVVADYKVTNGYTDLTTPPWITQSQAILTGIVFLLLVSILAFYGWRLNHMMKTTKTALQSQLPMSIIPITFIIFLCFVSRCIFNFVSAFGKVNIDLDTHSVKTILFWRIPSTQIGGITRRGKQTNLTFPSPTVAPGRVINQSQPPGALARLFMDPQRYDSDDETTSLLYKGSPGLYTGRNSPYSTTPEEQQRKQSEGESF
eukprot:gene1458-1691_t